MSNFRGSNQGDEDDLGGDDLGGDDLGGDNLGGDGLGGADLGGDSLGGNGGIDLDTKDDSGKSVSNTVY